MPDGKRPRHHCRPRASRRSEGQIPVVPLAPSPIFLAGAAGDACSNHHHPYGLTTARSGHQTGSILTWRNRKSAATGRSGNPRHPNRSTRLGCPRSRHRRSWPPHADPRSGSRTVFRLPADGLLSSATRWQVAAALPRLEPNLNLPCAASTMPRACWSLRRSIRPKAGDITHTACRTFAPRFP